MVVRCSIPAPESRRLSWGAALYVASALALFPSPQCWGENLAVEVLRLPPLRIDGRPARAHTQGLELIGGKYLVTARREDVHPKQALLLRTDAAATNWDVWDITPRDASGAPTALDHPGGMQSDGTRLWIPVAESRQHGPAVIRAFLLSDLQPGRPLKPVLEFPVNDHIGSIAVSPDPGLLFGANWETELVYVWDLTGHLQRTLKDGELEARGLGAVPGLAGRAGIAVQDSKVIGDRFYASGLFRSPQWEPGAPASRLCWFERFLEPDFNCRTVTLPRQGGIELAREAMAVSGSLVYFLPGDLGTSNRLFRVALPDLAKASIPGPPPTTTSPSAGRR
jgi:hypothetical protein